MRTHRHEAARLGDFIVAVYDQAAQYSTDPEQVSLLATRAITDILQRTRKIPMPPRPAHTGAACRRA